MKKGTRNGLIIAGVILVAGAITARKAGWIGASTAISVESGFVARYSITETVSASGKIQPEVEVSMSAEVSGEIVELPIVDGQNVMQGDLMVKIRPDIYRAAVRRAEAALNGAKAQRAQAEAQRIESEKNYNRSQTLHRQGVISDAEWDRVVSTYQVSVKSEEAAAYQVLSSEATLNEAKENLLKTTIYAPISGTVSALQAELGERVVGTAQMAGTEILRIADLSRMEVVVEVNENDIIRVSTGDTARIEVDAYLDQTFTGVVSEIANSANISNMNVDQVTNFTVKVAILPESYAHLLQAEGDLPPLRPGMTATVEIETERVNEVLAVPIEAVTLRGDTSTSHSADSRWDKEDEDGENELSAAGDESFEVVFVYGDDGKAKLRTVETGIQDDRVIQIKSGLEDSIEIITGPYRTVTQDLKNGSSVSKEK